MNDSRRPLTCDFCGKAQNEVRILIAGPTVYICNECSSLCAEIVAERVMTDGDGDEHAALSAALPYIERMGEAAPALPLRSCEPRGERLASIVLRRMGELRESGAARVGEVATLGAQKGASK